MHFTANSARKSPLSLSLCLCLLALCLPSLRPAPAQAVQGDWPQWRGPNRDGISTETGLLQEWPQDGPALAWKTRGIGRGYATVALAHSKIFTTGDSGGSSYIYALDLKGKEVWSARLGKAGERGGFDGPRGTPTVSDNLVYALGQFGDLLCVEAATGKERWRKHLKDDFDGKVGGWGYSESPLVDGNKLICTPGGNKGTLLALDTNSGDRIWRSTEYTDSAEYSSPILGTIGGVKQYIQLTGRSVAGVATTDGSLLWRADRRGSTAVVPTPILHQDHIYVCSGYNVGCNLFDISKSGNQFETDQTYANKVMVNHHGGVVLYKDHLYGFSDGKGWTCQNFKSGQKVWSEEKIGKGALVYADGRFYLRSESGRGTVALIEATPEGYHEKGRFDQPERSGKNSWPHPVVAGGKLYLRDQDLLLCYDLTDPTPTSSSR